MFLLGLWGGCQTAPQSFNHVFTSFGTITVAMRKLGGTIQRLLYNGIIHNFDPLNENAIQHIQTIYETEDRLMESKHIPSDFMLLIGMRRKT